MSDSLGIRVLKSFRLVGPMMATGLLLSSLIFDTSPGVFGAAGFLAIAGLLAHLQLVYLARHPRDE